MENFNDKLTEKKELLKAVKLSQSRANCASIVSSKTDVQREMQIETLEEEIAALQKGAHNT